MSAFKIDESKLRKADRVRLNIRRLVVERLEHLRNNVANAAEAREVDAAAKMLRNTEEAPMKRLRRRVRASVAWKTLCQLGAPEVSKSTCNKARQDILAELKLSAYEIEMADHYSLLPMGGPC